MGGTMRDWLGVFVFVSVCLNDCVCWSVETTRQCQLTKMLHVAIDEVNRQTRTHELCRHVGLWRAAIVHPFTARTRCGNRQSNTSVGENK